MMRTPWLSIALATACVAGLVIPAAGDFLIYERGAVASGELWRLFTAHVVHYTDAHLINNLMVLLPAMVLAELRSRKELVSVLTVSAAAICLAIFVFEPGVGRYAGASGVSLALVTFVALRGMTGNVRWRVICGTVLVLVGLKLGAENFFAWRWVTWGHETGIVTLTLAHVVGVLSGLLFWFVHIARGKIDQLVVLARAQIHQPGRAS